jgi:uncharacterized coiled-coil DUF342 family protein
MYTEIYPKELLKEIDEFHDVFLKFKDKINKQEDSSSEFYELMEKFNDVFTDKLWKQRLAFTNQKFAYAQSLFDELLSKGSLQ